MRNSFHSHLGRRTKFYMLLSLVAVLVGATGVVALIFAHASTPVATVEPETGTKSTQAVVKNDTTASAGQAVQFTQPSSIPFNTCTSPIYTKPANPSNPQDGITLSGYYVATDTWNFAKYPSSQQTMYICNYNNWYVQETLTDTANNGEVKNYPNVHKDFNSPGIGTFTSITSVFAHTAPTYGDWDYAYDIWFNGLNIELMIWTQSSGRQAHVPGITQVGTVTLSGQTYNIHKNGSYIAYDMPSTRTSGNLNLLEIIHDAVARGYIPSTATLSQIGYGVEGCNTNGVSTRFEVNNFSITSQ